MASSNERGLGRLAIAVAVLAILVGAGRWWWARHSIPSDLSRGGIELTYQVDAAGAIDRRFSRWLDELVRDLRARKTPPTAVAPEARSAVLAGVTPEQVKPVAAGLVVEATPDGRTRVSFGAERASYFEEQALQEQARTVYQRIEKVRWCVPTVELAGTRLKVGLPGVSAERLERLKSIIGMGAQLEFRELDPGEALIGVALPDGVKRADETWTRRDTGESLHAVALEASDRAALDRLKKTLALPGGVEALIERHESFDGEREAVAWRLELVRSEAEVTGDMVDEAEVATDKFSRRPQVALKFSDEGGRRFAELSTRLIGKKLAIVLDGEVLSVPVIETRIAGGRAVITMGTRESPEHELHQVEDLAAALRGGGLPAPMALESERQIAPR